MGFVKNLNLFDSIALVIGSMIGSGIFLVSADMSRQLGSSGWLIVAWSITGIMTVIAALCYGELASMMPHTGGIYVYLREAFGSLTGFLYGWTLFVVIQSGTIAAVAMAFAKFSGVIIPWVSADHILIDLKYIQLNTIQFTAVSSILLLTGINTLGVKEGKRVQNIFTLSKIIILVLFIIMGCKYVLIHSNNIHFQGIWHSTDLNNGMTLSGMTLVIALGVSMVGSLFSADAWYNITFASSEVINPKKIIPTSLIWGTAIVCTLYILINLIYVFVLPVSGKPEGINVIIRGISFAREDRVGTAVMYVMMGNVAAIIMAGVIVISTFGCNNGIILSGARVYYAMSEDGLFFSSVGKLNRKGVPARGLIFQAIWSIILCFSGTYIQLLNYVMFAVLFFNVLIIISIFILRNKRPDEERRYKAPGYPYLPASYIVFCLWVMIAILFMNPEYSLSSGLILLSGIPVFYLWKRFIRT